MIGHHARMGEYYPIYACTRANHLQHDSIVRVHLCQLNSKTIKDYEYKTWYTTKYFVDFQRRFSAYCAKNGSQPTHPAPVASPVIVSFASWFAPQLNFDARKKSCSNCLENFCCLYDGYSKW